MTTLPSIITRAHSCARFSSWSPAFGIMGGSNHYIFTSWSSSLSREGAISGSLLLEADIVKKVVRDQEWFVLFVPDKLPAIATRSWTKGGFTSLCELTSYRPVSRLAKLNSVSSYGRRIPASDYGVTHGHPQKQKKGTPDADLVLVWLRYSIDEEELKRHLEDWTTRERQPL